MSDKQRIIELQKSLRIVKIALEKIASCECHFKGDVVDVAQEALDQIWPLERKAPLQGLVGHGRNVE